MESTGYRLVRLAVTMTQVIEYFFSISSPWAYLGSGRLVTLAESHGLRIKPLMMTNIDEHGWIPLKSKPPVRQRYVRTEIGRWSRHLGVPIQMDNRPGDLKDPTPAAMMVVAAETTGTEGLPLALALQRAYWESAADIGVPEIRRAIADALRRRASALLRTEPGGRRALEREPGSRD
jgi:2-hydroxychromene-2-carboxylate isomerase